MKGGEEVKSINTNLNTIKTSNYPFRGDSNVGKKRRREAGGKGRRVILHRREHIELFAPEGFWAHFDVADSARHNS